MPTPGVAFDSEIHVKDEFPVGPGVGWVPDLPPNSSVYVTLCPGVHIQRRQRHELPLGREKIYSRAIVSTIPADVPNEPFRQAEGVEDGGENNAEDAADQHNLLQSQETDLSNLQYQPLIELQSIFAAPTISRVSETII